MKRNYETGEANDIIFFTGVEVEKTPAYGMKTLFVTGIQDHNEIMKFYETEQCEHIFFGANHSYQPVTSEEFDGRICCHRAPLFLSQYWRYNSIP